MKNKIFLITAIIFISTILAVQNAFASVADHIEGDSCYQTAVNISQKGWANSDEVVIATSSDFSDGLAGAVLAIQKNIPVLFMDNKYTSDTTLGELSRLNVRKAYILGGSGAISTDIENIIQGRGIITERLQGADRYETAVAIGNEVMSNKKADTAFLAYGENFPDALSASVFAGKSGYPIVLTDTSVLNNTTKRALADWGIKKIYILGGTGVLSAEIENQLSNMSISAVRLGGQDRYETAEKVIENFDNNTSGLILATGNDFHDALAASVYAAKVNCPVMLYDYNVNDSIKNYVENKNLTIVGNVTLDYNEEQGRIEKLEQEAENQKKDKPYFKIKPAPIVPASTAQPTEPAAPTAAAPKQVETRKAITSLTDTDIQRLQAYENEMTMVDTDFATLYSTKAKSCEALLKMFSSDHLYPNAKVNWVTDPHLVYRSVLGDFCVRGVLELTYYRENDLNLVPNQKYNVDVEYDLKYSDDDDNVTRLKLNGQPFYLSPFYKVVD